MFHACQAQSLNTAAEESEAAMVELNEMMSGCNSCRLLDLGPRHRDTVQELALGLTDCSHIGPNLMCVCVCMYVCMYIYIYMYTCIQLTLTLIPSPNANPLGRSRP